MAIQCSICRDNGKAILMESRLNIYRCNSCLHTFTDAPKERQEKYDDDYFLKTHKAWFNNPNYGLFDFIHKKLLRLRFYGMEKTYYSVEHGYNSRLDELHAAILLAKLSRIEKYIEERIRLSDRYNDYLKNTGLILPKVAAGNKHVYYLYICRHRRRDYIISELKKRDIFVNISYP